MFQVCVAIVNHSISIFPLLVPHFNASKAQLKDNAEDIICVSQCEHNDYDYFFTASHRHVALGRHSLLNIQLERYNHQMRK